MGTAGPLVGTGARVRMDDAGGGMEDAGDGMEAVLGLPLGTG